MAKIKALIIFLLPSILVGMVIGLLPGYKVYEYVWKNADFCLSCHVHDYATIGWKNSAHGQTTTCHDCHHQPLRAYIRETYIMIKDRPKFPKDLHHTPYVKIELCAACHISDPEDKSTITGPMSKRDVALIPKVDESVLHKAHLSKKTNLTLMNTHEIPEAQRVENPTPDKVLPKAYGSEREITCADCHGGPTNRAHNFNAVDISCVRCHEHVHNTTMVQKYGCRNCHFQDFLTPMKNLSEKNQK